MAKNDFRVTSIFKIIIRVRMNGFVCLIKYVENKISNSASHKKKEEQNHTPTFLKLLKNFH